jgi:hypothetical protein
MASYLLSHYLSASGTDVWIIPSDFTFNNTFTRANELVLQALRNSSSISSLLDNACQCGGIAGRPIMITDRATFNTSGVTESDGLHYAYGGGGVTVRSMLPTNISGSWTEAKRFQIRTATQIEVYDKYDWCFGSDACESSDYHFGSVLGGFFKTTVGEFFALENAGMARQFDWYSGWIVVHELEGSCNSGSPSLQVVSVSREAIPGLNQDTGIIPRPFRPLSEVGYTVQIAPPPDETLDCDGTIVNGICQ